MNNINFEKIKEKYQFKKITRSRAIKLYCKEQCCCGDLKSWKKCTFTGCFLYNFRGGNIKPKEQSKSSEKSPFLQSNSDKNIKSETTETQ